MSVGPLLVEISAKICNFEKNANISARGGRREIAHVSFDGENRSGSSETPATPVRPFVLEKYAKNKNLYKNSCGVISVFV